MPLATLLNPDDPIFDWEHTNAHRQYFAVMAPLTRFSALPYRLDPRTGSEIRAGPWNLDHQQAHTDYTLNLPPRWDAPAIGHGIPNTQILIDSDLQDPESRSWWTFINHQEHFIANEAILPLNVPVTYPFW